MISKLTPVFVLALSCAVSLPADELVVCARPNPGFLIHLDDTTTGLEYDILAGFAAAQGATLELRWLDSFGALLPAVESGDCDVGSAAITVTEERAEKVDFSVPYFPVRALLAEPIDQPPLEAQDLEGVKVAAVGGTLQASLLSDLGAAVYEVADDESLFEAVQNGTARALACDSATLLTYLESYPGMRVGAPLSERSFFAFALPKGSALGASLDSYLQEIQSSGAYRQLVADHFGEDNADFIVDDIQ